MAHAIGFPAIQFSPTLHVRGGSVSRRGLNQVYQDIRPHSQAEPPMKKHTRQTPAALRERGVWGERGFSQRSRLSPQRPPSHVSSEGGPGEGASLQRSLLPRKFHSYLFVCYHCYQLLGTGDEIGDFFGF